MRVHLVWTLLAVGCGSQMVSGTTTVSTTPVDPPSGSAPAWDSDASTIGMCTPSGFIEALGSVNGMPVYDVAATWFSCPGATCIDAGNNLVACGPELSDAAPE